MGGASCDTLVTRESDLVSSAPINSGKVGVGWNSMLKPAVDLAYGKRVVARARVYLYQAPFTPSVRYSNGVEYFVLPAGWGVLRSRQGLLAWLELMEDAALEEAAAEVVAMTQLANPRRTSTGSRMGSASPSPSKKGGAQFVLTLPGSQGAAPHAQVDLRNPRAFQVDAAIRLACEDVLVLRPTEHSAAGSTASGGSPGSDGGASGLRLGLGAASQGGVSYAAPSFDDVFKGWLSSCGAQV